MTSLRSKHFQHRYRLKTYLYHRHRWSFCFFLSLLQLLSLSSAFSEEDHLPKKQKSSPEVALGARLSVTKDTLSTLNQLSLELSAITTPPSAFEERRFLWRQTQNLPQPQNQSQNQIQNSSRASSTPPFSQTKAYQAPPSRGYLQRLLEQFRGIRGYLPRAALQTFGQGFPNPLNQSQSERQQNLFSLDQHTGLKNPPLKYTSVYTPSVAPFAREMVYNGVSDLGDLYLKSSKNLKTRAPFIISKFSQCIQTTEISAFPTSEKTLLMGHAVWIAPQDLDLSCARSICRQTGVSCYLGSYDITDWQHPRIARGISSVAPSQQLALMTTTRSLTLLSDEADNLYISSRENIQNLSWLHLLVAVQSSYLSGSWRSGVSAHATWQSIQRQNQHLIEHAGLALELPRNLKSQVRSIAPFLGLNAREPYHEVLYKLTDWHRSFTLGTLDESDEGKSLYERLLLSQKGVCRHRSYTFLVTARALGIPTRFVVNAAHAFVEVLDPTGAWRRVNLGGEGPFLERSLDQRLEGKASKEHLRDGLPQPLIYRESQENSAKELNAYYQTSPSEQRLLQSSHSSYEEKQRHEFSDQADWTSTSSKSTDHLSHQVLNSAHELFGVGSIYSAELTRPSQDVSQQSYEPSAPIFSISRKDLDTLNTNTNSTELDEHSNVGCLPPKKRDAQRFRMPILKSTQDIQYMLSMEATLKGKFTPVRCAWIEVSGQVTLPASVKRNRKLKSSLKGTKIQLVVTSDQEELLDLEGWGQIDRKGHFSIKSRVPFTLPSSQFKLSVHLPQQGPWKELIMPVSQGK